MKHMQSKFFFLFLCVLSLSACWLDVSNKWTESVDTTQYGKVVLTRTKTNGPDAFFRAGKGGQKRMTLSFEHPLLGKVRYIWDGYTGGPAGFDIVDGIPWLVVPIDSCNKYEFPPEGFIVLAYKEGKWVRMPVERAPQSLKANLLDDQEVFSLRQEYYGNPKALNELQAISARRAHKSLGELAKEMQHEGGPSSCLQTQPIARQGIENALKIFDTKPRTDLMAVAVGKEDKIDQISGAEARALLGEWRDLVYASGCSTKIQWLKQGWELNVVGDPANKLKRPYARITLGTDLADVDSIYIPFPAFNDPNMRLDKIVCANGQIFVLIHMRDSALDVTSFDEAGKLDDAWRIEIPDQKFTFQASPTATTAKIIDFDASSDGFSFSIGTPSCQFKAEGNVCTLGERQLFKARMSAP